MGPGPRAWQHRCTPMEPEDDLTSQILNSLSALPDEEQAEVILSVVSTALKPMSLYRILEIRTEIITDLDPRIPLVRATLDLIDGQLALRAIGGDKNWR